MSKEVEIVGGLRALSTSRSSSWATKNSLCGWPPPSSALGSASSVASSSAEGSSRSLQAWSATVALAESGGTILFPDRSSSLAVNKTSTATEAVSGVHVRVQLSLNLLEGVDSCDPKGGQYASNCRFDVSTVLSLPSLPGFNNFGTKCCRPSPKHFETVLPQADVLGAPSLMMEEPAQCTVFLVTLWRTKAAHAYTIHTICHHGGLVEVNHCRYCRTSMCFRVSIT